MGSPSGDSFPLYTERWLGSARVRELTAAQKGVYIDLLAAAWDADGLPLDWRKCRAWAPWDAAYDDLQMVVEAFFPVAGDRRRNPKQEACRGARITYIQSQSEKGKKGAASRAARNRNSTAVPTAVDTAVPTPDSTRLPTEIQPARALAHAPASSSGHKPEPEHTGPEAATQPLVGLAPDGSPDPQPVAQPSRTSRSDVQAVVDHYRLAHPQARPGVKERALIAARLREGYSVEDLQRSLDGFHRSPWHTGENPGGKVYLSIKTLLRDSSQVAVGLEHANGSGRNGAGMTERELRSQRAGEEWLADMRSRDTEPENVTYEVK